MSEQSSDHSGSVSHSLEPGDASAANDRGCSGEVLTDAIDLLIAHGTVITMDPERRILRDGAIAIRDHRIVDVGPTARVASAYSPVRTVNAHGGVVQPGFVDCHTHVLQHLGRSTMPDSWSDEQEHAQWYPYTCALSPDDEYLATLLACAEMVRNGTTTVCDMGGMHSGERRAEAMRKVGLRGMLCDTVWDVPPYPDLATGDLGTCIERLERLVRLLPRTSEARVWGGVGLPGMGRCSDALLTAAKELADRHGLVLYMHQSFGLSDVAECRKLSGGRLAIEHLADLGLLGPQLQLVHMIHCEPAEVDLLADSHTNVVHCPSASLRGGMGVSRVGRFPEMISAGVNVALGSDAGNYSDAFDIARQAYLAATIHREARQQTPVVTCEQALEMATINGACAVGLSNEIGSLEPGKKADVVVHSPCRPEWHPGLDVVATLIYSAGSSSVDTVVVDGEIVCEGGALTQIDEPALYADVDAAAARLHQRMPYSHAYGRWPQLVDGKEYPGLQSAPTARI